MLHHEFEAIGTSWSIDMYDEVSSETSQQLLTAIAERIETFDSTYSRFRSDSLVTQMSHATGTYQLPADSTTLFSLYRDIYELTDGSFTPLIGSVLEEAGYDIKYSLQPKTLHQPTSWDETFNFFQQTVEMKRPTILDFGAAGKGYLVDIISEIISDYGFNSFCVNGSGDMYYQHTAPELLRVGLEHPDHTDQAIGVAGILNQALCGSATNRRRWGTFHHVIDPHTLISPNTIKALWVVADTAIVADALTTALFFTPAELLSTKYTFEYAVVRADNSLQVSHGFPADFF